MEPGDTVQSRGDIPHRRTAGRLPIRFLPLMVFSGEGG
jgi:hypothetical protein